MKPTLHKKKYSTHNVDVANVLLVLIIFLFLFFFVALAMQAQNVYTSLGLI